MTRCSLTLGNTNQGAVPVTAFLFTLAREGIISGSSTTTSSSSPMCRLPADSGIKALFFLFPGPGWLPRWRRGRGLLLTPGTSLLRCSHWEAEGFSASFNPTVTRARTHARTHARTYSRRKKRDASKRWVVGTILSILFYFCFCHQMHWSYRVSWRVWRCVLCVRAATLSRATPSRALTSMPIFMALFRSRTVLWMYVCYVCVGSWYMYSLYMADRPLLWSSFLSLRSRRER